MPDKKTILDLIPSGPTRSEPFDFRGQKVRWRLLDGLEMASCRQAADKRIMRELVDEHGLEPKDAFPLLQASSNGDTWREWFEHYVLAAALTDEDGGPISLGSPDEVALRLMDLLTPIERGRWIDDYLSFADEHDPSNLTEAEIEEIVEAAGKTEGASIWQRYGSSALRNCLATMVPRLIKAEMAVAEMGGAPKDFAERLAEVEAVISQISRSPDGGPWPAP